MNDCALRRGTRKRFVTAYKASSSKMKHLCQSKFPQIETLPRHNTPADEQGLFPPGRDG